MKPDPGLHVVPGSTEIVAECASRYDERDPAPLRGVRDAKAVASVLKLYLDASPVPLLRPARPSDGGLDFSASAKKHARASRSTKVAALREFVSARLAVTHRDVLRVTCAHLRRVAEADAAAAVAKGVRRRGAAADGVQETFESARTRFVRALASSFRETLCGERTGGDDSADVSAKRALRDLVAVLIEHHEAVFGVGVENAEAGTRFAEKKASSRRFDEKENENGSSAFASENQTEKIERRDAATTRASAPVYSSLGAANERVTDIDRFLCFHGEDDRTGAVANLARSLFAGEDFVLCAELDRCAGANLALLYADTPVHELPDDGLLLEKTAIKRRLRAFDTSVRATSGRNPTKEEKKHLRPLYLRLARVKRQMQIVAARSSTTHADARKE